MASIVDLEFRASANFSDLISQVNAANQQIQRLNMSMRKLNVEGFNSAMASFSRSLAQSGQFTTQSLIIDDGVKKFGKALGQGNLSLRESTTAMREFIRTRDGQVRQLARQQVQLERSIWTSTGRSASGQNRGMLATPTGLPNDVATNAALATKEMQIFHRVINETSKGLINWGKNTQWAGRQLMVGLSIPLSIFGTTAAKTFMDFDKELTRLSRVYGSSITSSGTQALDSIKSQVKDLSRELSKALGIPAAETAGLAADLAATGLEGEKLIGAIKQTSILATLGEVDRQQAMKTTLSLQSVFRSDTKQLAKDIDFLNAVENQTSASIDDLTTAIPKAGPVVRGLGGDVKDLATMLVAMKEGGIPAGEAANAIKSSLSSLINPTKEVSKYMKSFGIDLTAIVDKNAGKLMPTLTEFQGKLNALDDLSRQRVLEKLFGKMQVGRITALFNNLNQEGSQSVEVMKLAGMATADLAALTEQELSRAANSVSGQFKRATENLKSNLVPVGEEFLKLGTKIFGALGTMLEKFNNLPSGFKQFILGLTTIVAVVGPVIMLVGVFANFFGYLVKAGVLLSAFKKGGLSAFKYVTAEQQAAKLAGDQLTKTFYDQVTATNTFKEAVANLALQFKELADNATAASAATVSASQSPAGREASSDVATESASQKPQKTARDLFRSLRTGVSGQSMMDLFDPEIVNQSKGSTNFKGKDKYNRTHLLDLSNDFWKTNPLSILGVMGSTSNKNQTLQEEWKVSSRDLYADTGIAQTVGINAEGDEADRLKKLEDAQKQKNTLDNEIAEREAKLEEARAAGDKKSESSLSRQIQSRKAKLANVEASLPELQRQAASYNRDEVIQTQAKALGKTRYLSEATPEEADTYAKERKGKTQAERVQLDADLKIGGEKDIKRVEQVYADSEQQAKKTMATRFAHIDQSTEAYAANLDSLITEYFVTNLAKLEKELQGVALSRGVDAEKIVYGDAKRSLTDETGSQSPEIQAADKNYQESMQRLAAAVDERALVQEQLTESEQNLKNIYDEAAGRTEVAIDKYNKALEEQALSVKALDDANKKVEKAQEEYAAAQDKVTSSTNATVEDLDDVSKKQAEFDLAQDERIAAAKRVTAADTAVTSTGAALSGAVAEEIIAADILTTEIIIETEQLRQSHPEDNDNVGDTTVVPGGAGGDQDKPKREYKGGIGKAGGAAFAVGGVGALTGQTSGPIANITQGAFAAGSIGMALEGLGVAEPIWNKLKDTQEKLASGMDTLKQGSGMAGKALTSMGTTGRAAMAMITGPVGWAILAVAALAAGIWYLNKRMSAAAETTQSFGKIGQDASELFNDKITKLRANLNGMKEDIDAATKRYDEMKKAIDGLDENNQIKKLIEDLKNEVSPAESVPRKMVQIYAQLVSQGMDAQKVRDLIQIVLDEAGQSGYKTVVNLAIDKINMDKNKQKALLENTFEGLFAGALEPERFDKWQKTSAADIQKNIDALAKSRDGIIGQMVKDGKTKKQAEELYDQQYNLVKTGVKGAEDALEEFGSEAWYVDSIDFEDIGIDVSSINDAQRAFSRLADDFKELSPATLKAAGSTISGIIGNINETDPAGLQAAINMLVNIDDFNIIFDKNSDARKQFIADLGVAGTLYENLIGEEDNSTAALQLAALAAAGVNDKLAEAAYNADKLDGTLGSVNSRLAIMQVVSSIDKALAKDIEANAPKVKVSTTAQGKKDAVASGYDAQKKAIQGKIDVIKKEIEAINKKLEAEKKAFEFERKMRASQISYREALAEGKFGEAALIKNQMNNDMLDKQKEDEAKAKIDPKQAQIDKLQKQLDAIDKLKENSSNTSVDTTDDVKNADNLEKAWTAVTDGISGGSIKSADDIKNKLSPALYDAIKKGGYGIDEFYGKARKTIKESIQGSVKDLDETGKEIWKAYTKGSKDLAEQLKIARIIAYVSSRGGNAEAALKFNQQGKLNVTRDEEGEITSVTVKGGGKGGGGAIFPYGRANPEGGNYATTPGSEAINGSLSNYSTDGKSLNVTVTNPPFSLSGGGANYYNYYGSGMGGSNSYSDMGGGANDYDSGMGGSNSYSGSGASAYNGRSSYIFGPQKSSALYDATADQRASASASSSSSSGTGSSSSSASSSASSSSSGTQDSSYLEGSADSSAGNYQKLDGLWLARNVSGPFDKARSENWGNYPLYNNRKGRPYGGHHAGLDYPASVGTNVFTTRGGKVVMSRYMASTPGYGNFVVVEDDKLKYVYAHLSTRNVKEGDSVVEGQQIGKTGRSGLRDSDPHLHFEVRDKDSSLGNRNWRSTYDPRNYLHTGGNVNKLSTADKSLKRDEVPAVLQSGEYVIQRKAVSRYGERFMDMINNGDLPGQAVPKFHTGGMVAYEDGPGSGNSMSYNKRTGKSKITRRKKRRPERTHKLTMPSLSLTGPNVMSQLAPKKGNKEPENPINGILEAARHAAVFGILASNPDIKKPFGSWKAADNISFGQAALASQNYIEFARRDATSQINSQIAGSGRKMSGFSGKNSKLLNAWSGGMDLASWALRPDSYIPVVKGANTGIRIISPLTKGIKAAARPLSRGAKSISSRVKNSRFASDRGEADINPMNWLRRGAKLSEKDAARTEEVSALLRASNKEAGSDAFSGMPSTELGELTGALGGHSSAIPGVNGTYRDAFGQLHVVKGHTDSASAYAEARGSQLTRDLFGLQTPDQKVIKFRHPITGDRMFGVRSTFDEKFAEPTGKFTDDEFYRQAVASVLRRDKDLQAENLYGNIVADQGQAFVASKASQPRTVGGLRLPVGDQVRANFLMEKAGARTWFAETTAEIAKRASKSEYSAGFQKAIDDALANFDSAMANLGKLSPEEKAMYNSLKDDLIQLSKTDWSAVQAHHAQIVPKVAKPKTDAAIKKAAEAKEARKLQAQESIDSGMPEWLLPMRDTLSARKSAMGANETGAANIDLPLSLASLGLYPLGRKLVQAVGRRIPRRGIESALDRGVLGKDFMDEISKVVQTDELAPKFINGSLQRAVLSDAESQVGSSSISKLKKLRRRSSLGDKISSLFDSNSSTDMIRITSGSDEGQLMTIKDFQKMYDSLPEEARGYLPEFATVKTDVATRTKGVTVGGMEPADRAVNATGEFLLKAADEEAWMYAGNFDRTIRPVRASARSKNSVSNNIMSIEQDFQGSGLATGFTTRMDSIYPRIGVDRNTVETADAGTSVWGKLGFDLDRSGDAGRMNRINDSAAPQWLDNMEMYGLDAEYPELYASIQAFKDGRNSGLSIKDIMNNPESSTIFRGSGWYGEKVYPKVEPKKSVVENALAKRVEKQKAKARASTTWSEKYDQMARVARGEEEAPKPTLSEMLLNRLTTPKAERSSLMETLKSAGSNWADRSRASRSSTLRAQLIPGPDDFLMAYDLGKAAMAAWRARNLVGASKEELMYAKPGEKVGYAKKVADLIEKLKARMPVGDKRSVLDQYFDEKNTPFNMRAQLIPGIDMLTGGLGRFLPKSRSKIEAQVRANQKKQYTEDFDAWRAEFGSPFEDLWFDPGVARPVPTRPAPEFDEYLNENIIQSQVEALMAQRGGLKLPSLSRTRTEPSTRGEGLLANAIKKIKSNTPSAKKKAEEAARIKKLDEEWAIRQEAEQQSAMRSRLNSEIRGTIDTLSRGNVELNRSSIEDLMGKISSAKKETEPLRWDLNGDSNKLDEYTVKANEFLQEHINKSMDEATGDNNLLNENNKIELGIKDLRRKQLSVSERASSIWLPADDIPLDELYNAGHHVQGINLIPTPELATQWTNLIRLLQGTLPGATRRSTNAWDPQRISDPVANALLNFQGFRGPLEISASRAAQIPNRRLIGTVAQQDSLRASRDAGPLPSDLTLPGDPLFRGYNIPSQDQYSTFDALESFMHGPNIIGGGFRVGGGRVGHSFSTALTDDGAAMYSNPAARMGQREARTRRLSPPSRLLGEESMVRRGEGLLDPTEKFRGFEDTIPPRPIDIDITTEPVGAIIMGWLSRKATKETSWDDEIAPLLTEEQRKATWAGGGMDSSYYHILSGDDVNGLRGNTRDAQGQVGGEIAIFNRSGMIMVRPDELNYPELSNMGEKIRTSYGDYDPNRPDSLNNIPPRTHLQDWIAKGWLKLPPDLNLPQLRSGGTINYDNTLANLHQGEMVLTQPLTQKLNAGINALSYMLARPNNSMSSVSSGQPAQQVASAPVSYYNLTVQPSPGMDEDALANRVVRKLKDHERRVGMARR